MKKINVYALPSHQTKERTSGVDYARVIQPMKYLNGHTYKGYTFEVKMFDIATPDADNWMEIGKHFDLVFLNYTVLDWHYAAMGSAIHGQNKKIIMDVDDAIWYVQPDNSTYEQLKKINAGYLLSCMLDDVDGVTTTNGYLRNMIMDHTMKYPDRIKVLPNMIDRTQYNQMFPAVDRDTITLMHFGATGHYDDLLDKDFFTGVDRIMQEFPNVVFKTVGSNVRDMNYRWGRRYSTAFGDVDIYKWIKEKFPVFMEEADIMVVPLRDTKYNRSKSDIKFIEAASAMKPGVFSRTRPYLETIKDGETGYLAQSADEWYEKIKALVISTEERNKIGQNAFDYTMKNRQIGGIIDQYAEYFLKVLDRV